MARQEEIAHRPLPPSIPRRDVFEGSKGGHEGALARNVEGLDVGESDAQGGRAPMNGGDRVRQLLEDRAGHGAPIREGVARYEGEYGQRTLVEGRPQAPISCPDRTRYADAHRRV